MDQQEPLTTTEAEQNNNNNYNTPSFEEGVAEILLRVEEHRQAVLKAAANTDDDAAPLLLADWQYEMEDLWLGQLSRLQRHVQDNPEDSIRNDLYLHVRQKLVEGLKFTIETITAELGDTPDQGAVARLFELNLLVLWEDLDQEKKQDEMQSVIDDYASYQRSVLRQRAKPAIAGLAQWRQQQQQQKSGVLAVAIQEEDDENDSVPQQPHSHAMTVILGQASALVHPLQQWKQALPADNADASMPTFIRRMCDAAIATLDEQAQTLTKTLSGWFWEDRSIECWMTKSSGSSATNATIGTDLGSLDAVVEEMAFGCQLLARYQGLLQYDTKQTIVVDQLLPDWTWTYATLERYLVTQQWQSALDLACPVHIVIGKSLQVPSVVEDAQYLSTRALERATSTRSVQAMGTVAHSLSHDVWSTDDTFQSGVHQALVEQRGCWAAPEESNTNENQESPPKSGTRDSFASALLDAFDEDLGDGGVDKKATSPPASIKPPSAPTSTGFLGSLTGLTGGHGQDQQMQTRLEMQLCALNGIQSASVACDSLVQSLDALLQDDSIFNSSLGDNKSMSMIQLAREELLRYAESYRRLLGVQVNLIVTEWCGSPENKVLSRGGYVLCLDALQDFFHRENYNLSSSNFTSAEAEERLERDMIGCLKQARIMNNLERCDADVVLLLCQELSSRLASIVLDSLWNDNKRVTDWGSLLLSKQVRLLQNYVSDLAEQSEVNTTVSFLEQWERVSQAVTILQLEKPSDWLAYQSTNVALNADELRRTFHLRVDFSSEAIAAVCGTNGESKQDEQQQNGS